MDEYVFFNPGDAIANDYDYAAARRSAQIYKAEHVADRGLVVAQDAQGQFSVFYEGGGDEADPASSKYTILAHL